MQKWQNRWLKIQQLIAIKARKFLRSFLVWRHKHMTDRQFVILLSILVGFSSGVAAILLKNMVHLIQLLIRSDWVADYQSILYFVYPGIGVLLTVLVVKYIVKKKVRHGIPSTLYAISSKNSRIPLKSTYASLLTSMITVGFGGSVGLEGPTVGSSSAIGSNLAKATRMNYKVTTLMLGCGAAGAMSGIFNAPIAAIVFALEVIMLDLTAASLIPLLMASVSAALTSAFMLGDQSLFSIELTEKFTLGDLPFYILLGILSGMMSVYFNKVFWSIESKFDRIRGRFKRVAIGAIALGLLIFLFPPLYGEGFDSIKQMLNGDANALLQGSLFQEYSDMLWVVMLFLLGVTFMKALATSITIGAGGIGGVFAPSLFMGSVLGFVFAKAVNLLSFIGISEKNFTLVGMGGVIAGILHAPLTALFLIAEITGGYELIIPLMLTAAISFMTSRYYNPHSLYNMLLAKRGELITHDKDKAVLTLMKLQTEVEKDFSRVHPDDTLRQLVNTVSSSRRNIFPVVEEDGSLAGVVLLDDIRQIMFDPNQYDKVLVKELMSSYPTHVSSSDSMDLVMKKFNESGAWNLPVIDNEKYVGFVSKSKLFNAYRKVLRNFSDE
ncbi:MAG: chloride channel protein [Flavobacteriales bacterium]|nr:chloride channel protein [Flavobacteriales bacterium]|tara:strand:- start:50972 stop:52795 length:1824 start_codon:yes stop_codon:yes gene_type:complete